MKRNSLLLILLFFLSSCNNADDSKVASQNNTTVYTYFTNFPISQFHTIKFGDNLSLIKKEINEIGGNEIAKDESIYYLIEADSTEIIIPNQLELTTFKVFLRDNEYISDETNFKSFLAEKANRVIEDSTFSIFFYDTGPIPFKLTYFLQSNFIRLHFLMTTLEPK